ncbi:MAG: leucine-rich repeat protein, partial [Clostridiales Family XIII bacterium]|nr:leucine-rich repeat protein [Clostridiales Family XIII bacterium]
MSKSCFEKKMWACVLAVCLVCAVGMTAVVPVWAAEGSQPVAESQESAVAPENEGGEIPEPSVEEGDAVAPEAPLEENAGSEPKTDEGAAPDALAEEGAASDPDPDGGVAPDALLDEAPVVTLESEDENGVPADALIEEEEVVDSGNDDSTDTGKARAGVAPMGVEPMEANGFTFSWDGASGSYVVTGYTGSDAVIAIPGTYDDEGAHGEAAVTAIGNSAFQNKTFLTGVTISQGIASIGNSAFSGCANLTDITIPESVTYLGDNAFNTTGLETFVAPGAVSFGGSVLR